MSRKKEKLSSKEKLRIVLEGMRDVNVSKVCRENGIYESQYYGWKKQLLKSAENIYQKKNKKDPDKARMEQKIKRLERTLLEQTCELQLLKKNENWD